MASRVSVRVPIWLTLIRMELAIPGSMPLLQDLGIGDEEVVADDLDLSPRRSVMALPAVPVALRQAVLDGEDGVLVHPVQRAGRSARRSRACGPRRPGRRARPCRTRRRPRPSPGRCPAGLEAGLVDGLQDRPRWPPRWRADRARSRPRRPPRWPCPRPLQDRLQGMEDLGPVAHRLAHARGPHGQDHELLEVDAVVRVLAPPLMMFIMGTGRR